MKQFKRFVAVTLIKPVTGPNAGFFKQQPNALTIRDLRVKFSIEKDLGKAPNKASITITNLAEATRSEIRKPMIVRLEVGYEGVENLQHLFSGDLRFATTTQDGPDVNTRLELGDGDRAYQFARVSRSFIPGASVLSAVGEAAKSMGVTVPDALTDALRTGKIDSGLTMHGLAHREMTALLTPAGFSWSIQDGKMVAVREKQLLENQALLLTPENGLVGSPRIVPAKKPGDSPMLNVRIRIEPRARCAGKAQVKSRDVNGVFRIEKVKHDGDSRGQEWFTDLDARQL